MSKTVVLELFSGEMKEGNVLFTDALKTFYLRLHGVGHVVKDHSDSERGNLLAPLHGLLFPISSNVSFICITPHTGQHVPLAGTKNSLMGPPCADALTLSYTWRHNLWWKRAKIIHMRDKCTANDVIAAENGRME